MKYYSHNKKEYNLKINIISFLLIIISILNILWIIDYSNYCSVEDSIQRGRIIQIEKNKDAIGLCQILEPIAKACSDTLNIRYKKDHTLWNEFKNIKIGFYFLVLNMDCIRSDSSMINATKIYLEGTNYKKK